MSNEHPPTPWQVVENPPHGFEIGTAKTVPFKTFIVGLDKATARRIVACVNAMEGLSTAAIEAGTAEGLDKARHAASLTARCKEVDYDYRALSPDKAWCAKRWCNEVGEVICAFGADEWEAVQSVHALAATYERDPSLYKG